MYEGGLPAIFQRDYLEKTWFLVEGGSFLMEHASPSIVPA